MIPLLCLVVLTGLLVIGALIDIESRRLPNWLTGAVMALYGLYVAVNPQPIDWLSAFAVAGVVFLIGLACFTCQLMGGGDVKLMTGLALWAGLDHIAIFLVVTSVAGGALSIVMLMARRFASSPLVLMAGPVSGLVAKRLAGLAWSKSSPSSADMAETDTTESLPYGVAIAAGGLTVIYALL